MRRLALSLMLCFAVNVAHADCDQPITPVTAQEKAYYQARFPVLRATIPKPPAGWKYTGESQDKLARGYTDYIPTQNCGPSNYYLSLGIEYQRPMSQAELEAEVQATRGPPDPATKQKLDALMAQQQALMQKFTKASEKGDAESLQAIAKQNAAVTAQITSLQQNMNSGRQAKLDALRHDRKAKVDIRINDASDNISCYGNPKPISVPGAAAYQCEAPATYSSPGEVLDPASGRVVVVFGNVTVKHYDWDRQDAQGKPHKDSYVEISYLLNGSRPMAVQNVVVDVSGDDLARAQSLFSQMDLKPLASLIKN